MLLVAKGIFRIYCGRSADGASINWAAVWDKAKTPGSETSTYVIKALYEAVKQIEAHTTHPETQQ